MPHRLIKLVQLKQLSTQNHTVQSGHGSLFSLFYVTKKKEKKKAKGKLDCTD